MILFCSRKGILMDSHVEIWAWHWNGFWMKCNQLMTIGNVMEQTILVIFWSELNPLLASLDQITQNPNFPILKLLEVVWNVCPVCSMV